MARMGHNSERAALIYQHGTRGADQFIVEAIDRQLRSRTTTRSTSAGVDGSHLFNEHAGRAVPAGTALALADQERSARVAGPWPESEITASTVGPARRRR
jgi:hypothetical protein